MKKTSLAAAILLVAAGNAVAGSDHYGSNSQQPATSSESMHTSSIRKTGIDAGVQETVRKPIAPSKDPGQGIWGH
ncbi:DUF680 domain-containing protein [Mesorhizobium sp. ES1-4]|uniref:DUF680 domain-containing protein n=1 Tax=Mesorhizobium sp. ES1-4 TaxID=2876627 RepID=UPI001CCA955A|nr:DUF680 domain-containing protein [Mesorhizobium sp. ES1-4]MBZ9799576.1 DUF680 domain-containing protein [Mesorhizobium sp. ES1-4]